MPSFHRYTDLSLIVAFLGAFGLLVNQRHLLLSVLCIERRFYGLNLFLVALAVLLDDRLGELFALFVLTLAAAESALALALLRAYFRVYGNILLREELKNVPSHTPSNSAPLSPYYHDNEPRERRDPCICTG